MCFLDKDDGYISVSCALNEFGRVIDPRAVAFHVRNRAHAVLRRVSVLNIYYDQHRGSFDQVPLTHLFFAP